MIRMWDKSKDPPSPNDQKGFQPKSLYPASTSSQVLAKWGAETYENIRKKRMPLYSLWMLELAFVRGRQYVDIDRSTGKLTQKKPPREGQLMVTVNQIRHRIRRAVAKITKDQPVPVAYTLDGQLHEPVTQLLASNHRFLQKDRVMGTAALWAAITGTGSVKTTWDATALAAIPKYSPSGVVGLDHLPEGNVSIEALSPIELMFDLDAKTPDQSAITIHAKTMHVDKVWDVYGEQVEPDSQGAEWALHNLYSWDQLRNDSQETAIVKEIWLRPCRLYPRGLVVTICGDKVLRFQSEWPYDFLPFATMVWDQNPLFAYGDGLVEDLMGPQSYLNKLLSQTLEYQERVGFPPLVVPPGWDVENYSKGGGIIRGSTLAGEPKLLNPGMMPNTLPYLKDWLSGSMDDSVAQHEVSQGGAPGRVESGYGISALIEQDETTLASAHHAYLRMCERQAQHEIAISRTYIKEPRVMQVQTETGAVNHGVVNASDLDGAATIMIELEAGGLNSTAEKSQKYVSLWRDQVVQAAAQGDPSARFVMDKLSVPFGKLEPYIEKAKAEAQEAQMQQLQAQAALQGRSDELETQDAAETGEALGRLDAAEGAPVSDQILGGVQPPMNPGQGPPQ